MKKIKMLLDNGFDPDLRVYKEAQFIIQQGYDVEILCLDRKNKYIDKQKECYDKIQINRFFVRNEKTTKSIENNAIIAKLKYFIYIFWFFKYIRMIKKYLKDEEYEILHCHDLAMALCGVLFFRKKKIVFDMHEYYSNKKSKVQNWFIKRIVKYVQKKATWIIHVNEFQIKELKEKEKSKLIFLPNYPLKNKFLNYTRVQSNDLRISYTGYVRHYIPLLNLMKAVDKLEGVKVYINGSGDVYSQLLEQAKNLKNTILTGKYESEDVVKFYENTDLVYIVYNQGNKNDETAFPTKFFEAIITEIPMIVSKNSAMEKFVEEYDIGFVVDGTNPENISNLIVEIKKSPKLLENKKKNLREISNQYSWEDVVQNLQKIYVRGNNEKR